MKNLSFRINRNKLIVIITSKLLKSSLIVLIFTQKKDLAGDLKQIELKKRDWLDIMRFSKVPVAQQDSAAPS